MIVLGFSAYKQAITMAQWSKGGLGYASFQWYDSEAMAYLRKLPTDLKIYTNEPGAVYLYVGRGAVVLPIRYDSATTLPSDDFTQGVTAMQNDVNSGDAVLAIFDHGDNIPQNAPTLTTGLHIAFKAQGDAVYTKP